MSLSYLLWPLAVLLACLAMAALYLALLSRHRKSGTGDISLIGLDARVLSDLTPEGSVIVNGELWRARLLDQDGRVERGRMVRIVSTSGHLLLVKPLI